MKKSNIKVIKKIIDQLEDQKDELVNVFEDEEAIVSSRTEKWLDSDKGQHASNCLSELENAIDSIERLYEELTNSIEEYED